MRAREQERGSWERQTDREKKSMVSAKLQGVSEEGALRLQGKLVESLRKLSSAEPEILAKFTINVLEDLERRNETSEERIKKALRSALLEFNSDESVLREFLSDLLDELRRENWLLLTDPQNESRSKPRNRRRFSSRSRSNSRSASPADSDREEFSRRERSGGSRQRSRSPVGQRKFGRQYGNRDRDRGRDRERGDQYSSGRGGRYGRDRERDGYGSERYGGGRGGSRRTERGGRQQYNSGRERENNRGGSTDRDRHSGRGGSKARTTLHVGGLPKQDANLERKLRSHFYRFGIVLDMKVRGENAFVQYKTRDDAQKALNSPHAILGNRFIECKWARFDNLSEDALKEKEEKRAQEKEEKQREGELKAKLAEIQRQKEALLLKQLQHQKNLVAQLQKKAKAEGQQEDPSGEAPVANPTSSNASVGAGTTAAATTTTTTPLNASAAPFHASSSVGGARGRGRGGFRGRGRGGSSYGSSSYKLNASTATTKSVKISNVPEDVKGSHIQEHFGKFGSLVSCDKTLGGDFILEFGDRKMAEQAIIKGKKINDNTTLQMQWVFK